MGNAGVVHYHNLPPVHGVDRALDPGKQHLSAVPGHPAFNAGAHNRRLRLEQRHCLPLHIAAHQGAVGVIVLQKRNQRRRHAHNLERRYVGIFHRVRPGQAIVVAFAHFHQFLGELLEFIKSRIGLGNAYLFLNVRGQVADALRPGIDKRRHINHGVGGQAGHPAQMRGGDGFPGGNYHFALAGLDIGGYLVAQRVKVTRQAGSPAVAQPQLLDYRPVGGLNKTQTVDPGVGGQAAEQANVGAFRGFNRANAPIVRSVNIAHIKAGALPREAAAPQGRKAALVSQFRQRVGLVHKLGQLVAAKKLPDGAGNRADIDHFVRHHVLRFFQPRDPILHHPVHPQQAKTHLVAQQLPGHPHPAVAEMVNVIPRFFVVGVEPD